MRGTGGFMKRFLPKNKLTFADVVVCFAVVLLSVCTSLGFGLSYDEKPRQIEIIVQNQSSVYSLEENDSIEIESCGFRYVIEISGGEVFISSATCPDKTCTHMKPVGKRNGSIVCIPGEIIIKTLDERGDGDEADIVLP